MLCQSSIDGNTKLHGGKVRCGHNKASTGAHRSHRSMEIKVIATICKTEGGAWLSSDEMYLKVGESLNTIIASQQTWMRNGAICVIEISKK